jgi:NAD(P)-dependent dehydrogenase (short-subunit alcohol dehydrogenase family)
LGGAILFSQRFLEFFKEQGHGNLIHVSSIMGVVTPKFENYAGTNMTSPIEYTAIKAALIAITKYLAKYYKGNNIRVNCISPGGILDQQPESFLKKYQSCCNDKGMLAAEDVVGTALYLLSDQSRYVTGQNIIVDDGWSL